jgi:hypothetical protein
LCTRCKKVTDGKVEGFYQLLAGEEAMKCVKALTNEDQDYIYPVNSVCSLQFLLLALPHCHGVSFRMELLMLKGRSSILALSRPSKNYFFLEAAEHWLRNMRVASHPVFTVARERMN